MKKRCILILGLTLGTNENAGAMGCAEDLVRQLTTHQRGSTPTDFKAMVASIDRAFTTPEALRVFSESDLAVLAKTEEGLSALNHYLIRLREILDTKGPSKAPGLRSVAEYAIWTFPRTAFRTSFPLGLSFLSASPMNDPRYVKALENLIIAYFAFPSELRNEQAFLTFVFYEPTRDSFIPYNLGGAIHFFANGNSHPQAERIPNRSALSLPRAILKIIASTGQIETLERLWTNFLTDTNWEKSPNFGASIDATSSNGLIANPRGNLSEAYQASLTHINLLMTNALTKQMGLEQ
jgi:hypothetical protein